MGLWQNFRNKERSKQIFYILIILLVLLALILGAMYAKKYFDAPKQNVVNQPTTQNNNTVPNSNVPTTIQQREGTPEEKAEQAKQEPARLVAQPFVERFGSYNNQGEFLNFSDLDFFMTASLKEWVNSTYIPKLKKELPSIDTYYAINTKALSTEIVALDETAGKAELLINTQRQEVAADGSQTRVYYQTSKVIMVKVGNDWKIDAVYWL